MTSFQDFFTHVKVDVVSPPSARKSIKKTISWILMLLILQFHVIPHVLFFAWPMYRLAKMEGVFVGCIVSIFRLKQNREQSEYWTVRGDGRDSKC